MAHRPTLLNKLLVSQTPLRRRLEDARAQSLLGEQLSARLPPSIRPHCLGARLAGDTLVVLADSAIWGTRLRYELPRILGDFPVRKFRVRVVPAEAWPPPKAFKPRRLPAEAAEVLKQTAAHQDDPELAAVLRRLASHGGNKD